MGSRNEKKSQMGVERMKMNLFFNGLWNVSIQFAGIVLILLLVRKIFSILHVPKKFAYFLWLIPLIRLLCPVNIESVVSIWPEKAADFQAQVVGEMTDYYQRGFQEQTSEQNDTNSGVHDDESSGEPEGTVTGNNGKSAEVDQSLSGENNGQGKTGTDAGEQDSSSFQMEGDLEKSSSGQDIDADVQPGQQGILTKQTGENSVEKMVWSGFLAVWMLGFLCLLVRNFWGYFRLKKQVQVSIPVETGVYKADHIYTAFVLGWLKPLIYLPHYISEEQYAYVVMHERMHIQRKDHWMKLIFCLLRYFYWWNPFVWLMYYFMEKDMEMSCDEAVLKRMGEEKRGEYAEALLELTTAGSNAVGMSLCFAESEPESRIKNIMRYQKPVVAAAVLSVLVLAVLFAGLLTTPVTKKKTVPAKTDASATETAEIKKVLSEDFFGKYIDYPDMDSGGIEFLEFTQDGHMELQEHGTYAAGEEGGEYILSLSSRANRVIIRKKSNDTYEFVNHLDGDNPGILTASFRFEEGTDGLEGEESFYGVYRCVEEDVNLTCTFFSDGTYSFSCKATYQVGKDGKITPKNKFYLMGDDGEKLSSRYYTYDEKYGILTYYDQKDNEKEFVNVKNIYKAGTYHFMGEDGNTRQNFYIQLDGDGVSTGSYSFYCGKGAGISPYFEKSSDYDFYTENCYTGSGTFTVKNGILTLKDGAGAHKGDAASKDNPKYDDQRVSLGEWYFKIEENRLLFTAENNGEASDMPVVPFVLEDGAVFEYTGGELAEYSEKTWEKMLFKVNNILYHGSSDIDIMGDSGAVEGRIRSSVEEGKTPEINGESNFGGYGNPYTYDDGDGTISVFMGDSRYHIFYQVKEKTAAEKKKEQELFYQKADAIQFVYHDKVKENENGKLSYKQEALIADGSCVESASMEAFPDAADGEMTTVLKIQFDKKGTEKIAAATKKLAETSGEIAILSMGKIISAPAVHAEITDGNVMITLAENDYKKMGKIIELLNQ